ncbi:hypothetical protein G9A89_013696 [Geosiphon pyriformis]|nr:hypothetical protein G9A89_013696 [Geosiphon pyriformis]
MGKFLKRSVDFHVVKHNSNLDNIWDILKRVVVDSANEVFFRLWFSEFEGARNKFSSKLHRSELLMSKITSSLNSGLVSETDCLVGTWTGIDSNKASKVRIMIDKKDWTRKCLVAGALSGHWNAQYTPLSHINDDTFSGIMSVISMEKLLQIIKNLPDSKTAGLFGIPNKLWKHSTSTQSPIFAVGSIVEDALKKNKELWLVLQDMHKAYNSVG